MAGAVEVNPEPSCKNNYFTEMCSGSEAGSYSRLIECVSVNTSIQSITEEEGEGAGHGGGGGGEP